jgi:plasmid maintenance system killer protein
MQIAFKNSKLKKLANSDREALKKLGKQGARKLRARLDELDTVTTLEEMRHLPAARCHELKGDLKGSLAVDLHGGWRIVFEPDHNPLPEKEDGGLDWLGVEGVLITDITDYHD